MNNIQQPRKEASAPGAQTMKKIILTFITFSLLSLGAFGNAHGGKNKDVAPETVMHVVTVSWKAFATDEQIQAALDGVKQLAHDFDGITRVWIKTLKAQGERSHAFAMEFKSQEALEEYAGSDAQKAWYEVYTPIRDRSTTFDITNE